MTIAFFEIEEWEETLVRSMLPDEQVLFFREPLEATHLPKIRACDVLVVFIYSKVDASVIAAMPDLKLVCTMSTGFDHISLTACKERSITVTNVPTYGDHTVAQHTFALLLALSRKIVPSIEQVRKGDFAPRAELRGRDIQGQTIGVIGTGKIGRNVIRIAKGFEMNVIAYDPFPNEQTAREFGFRYVTLDELYAISDIITIHVPLLPSTQHLINAEAIAKMKRGVMILNTSRGGIIDTRALYSGLLEGAVGGAGLDVLEEETAIKEEKQLMSMQFQASVNYHTIAMNHVLINHPNVIVTPHNAFNSVEALTRIIRTTIENVKGFRDGKTQNTIR